MLIKKAVIRTSQKHKQFIIIGCLTAKKQLILFVYLYNFSYIQLTLTTW